jgi:hypothetical protein
MQILFPFPILMNNTPEHTEHKYMRGAISSLVLSHIHLISLYRYLQGIYGMSPLGHIYGMSPINPLIEEFLTLTEK